MAFPPHFLDELRTRLPLSEVVARRLRLIRAGREFKAPCPFHNEKTPSFTVNDQKGFFHCFGCGAHGDVIGFVMRHDNLSFPEAIELLAAAAGLEVPRESPEDRQRHHRQKSLHDLLETATKWFEHQLHQPAGRSALDYLTRRGLDEAAIARFRLGYAPGDGAALRHHLTAAGFAESDLIEVGLVRKPDDGRAPYSFFRNRVIFPVADRRGRVVAFGARILDGDGPKYINSPESSLFHKGQLLYGLSRARQAVADGQPVVVAEGYMDVISLVEAGFAGAVAPLGTALTETQIETLWRLYPGRDKTPILCFDGDNAGRRAAARAVERVLPLLGPDQTVRVAFLPDGEDPDSLVRSRGPKAMQAVLDHAAPLADVLWECETAGRRFDTPESRAGLRAALELQVDRIADRNVQAFYRQHMRARVESAFQTRRTEAAAPWRGQGGRPNGPGRGKDVKTGATALFRPQQRAPRPPSLVQQRLMLATLINHPMLFDEVGEALTLMVFPPGPVEKLRQAVVVALGRGGPDNSGLDAAGLQSHLSCHGFDSDLSELLSRATYVDAGFSRPDAPIDQAREGWWAAWRHLQGKQAGIELRQVDRVLAASSEIGFVRLDALRREVFRATSGGPTEGEQGLDGDNDTGGAG